MNKKNNESSNCCPDHVTGYGEFYDELDGNVNYSTNKYYASGSGNQVGQYIGYKVDGSDKLFYYRDLNADGNNNINIKFKIKLC